MRVHSISVAVAAILIGTAQAAPHFPSSNNGAVAVAPRGLVSDVLSHLKLRSSKESSGMSVISKEAATKLTIEKQMTQMTRMTRMKMKMKTVIL